MYLLGELGELALFEIVNSECNLSEIWSSALIFRTDLSNWLLTEAHSCCIPLLYDMLLLLCCT